MADNSIVSPSRDSGSGWKGSLREGYDIPFFSNADSIASILDESIASRARRGLELAGDMESYCSTVTRHRNSADIWIAAR